MYYDCSMIAGEKSWNIKLKRSSNSNTVDKMNKSLTNITKSRFPDGTTTI